MTPAQPRLPKWIVKIRRFVEPHKVHGLQQDKWALIEALSIAWAALDGISRQSSDPFSEIEAKKAQRAIRRLGR